MNQFVHHKSGTFEGIYGDMGIQQLRPIALQTTTPAKQLFKKIALSFQNSINVLFECGINRLSELFAIGIGRRDIIKFFVIRMSMKNNGAKLILQIGVCGRNVMY